MRITGGWSCSVASRSNERCSGYSVVRFTATYYACGELNLPLGRCGTGGDTKIRCADYLAWCRKSGVVEYVKELKITESILVQFRDELNRAAMKQAEVSELACYARTIPRSYVGGRCSKH